MSDLFDQKVWTDQQVQYSGRRRLTDVNTSERKSVLVERNEGTIFEEGNLFDAANINDLEERIALAFDEIEQYLINRINLFYPVGKIFLSMTNLHLEDANQQVFPGTTWARLQDRVFMPVNPETQQSEQVGGNATFSITPQGRVVVTSGGSVGRHYITLNEMPAHHHYFEWSEQTYNENSGYYDGEVDGWELVSDFSYEGAGGGHVHGFTPLGASFGGQNSGNFNSRQLCTTVFAWRRTG